jgi:hypothetical protein
MKEVKEVFVQVQLQLSTVNIFLSSIFTQKVNPTPNPISKLK